MLDETTRRIQDVIESQTGTVEDHNEALRGFDSIDRIQFACDLEEEFGVTVKDDDLNGLQNVSQIADYIESLICVRG